MAPERPMVKYSVFIAKFVTAGVVLALVMLAVFAFVEFLIWG
jgi:hypothetical protein